MWDPISTILEIDRRKLRSVRRVREMLLEDSFFQRVGAVAGTKVAEVIRRCLAVGVELGIGQMDDERSMAAQVQDVYYEKVILELDSVSL